MNPLSLLTKSQRKEIIDGLRKQDEERVEYCDLCFRFNDAYFAVIYSPLGWRLNVIGMDLVREVETRTRCIDILENLQ